MAARKKHWSLWDIKNRWLRAVASWAFMTGVLLIYPLIWLTFITIVLFIASIEFYSSVREHVRSEVRILLPTKRGARAVIALLTAREKPRE